MDGLFVQLTVKQVILLVKQSSSRAPVGMGIIQL